MNEWWMKWNSQLHFAHQFRCCWVLLWSSCNTFQLHQYSKLWWFLDCISWCWSAILLNSSLWWSISSGIICFLEGKNLKKKCFWKKFKCGTCLGKWFQWNNDWWEKCNCIWFDLTFSFFFFLSFLYWWGDLYCGINPANAAWSWARIFLTKK